MLYREYGKTGKKLSVIGFGGMRFENTRELEKSAEMLLYASELGINYFDTAPAYLHGKSEKIFGLAFEQMKRSGQNFYVSSKSAASKPSVIRGDLEHSLSRMGLDKLDFYHVWCVMSPEDFKKRRNAGVLEEFRKIREEGLADHICISTHMNGGEIRELLAEEDFDGITLGYSAVNFPFREDGLRAAAEKNMGVVIMNPLGGGTIVNNPDTFSFLKNSPDENIVDSALHFLLSDPSITTALVGFGRKEHISQAAAAVDSFKAGNPAGIEDLKLKIRDEFQSLCTSCGYCNVCPEDIKVWAYMEAYNHVILKSLETAEQRIRWHWHVSMNDLEKCIECGGCEQACTQHLPIIERFGLLKKETGG